MPKPHPRSIQPAELGFFAALAGAGSLSAAGRELGISTAAVSKRLAAMEQRLALPLVNRTTRRMGLTPEGELMATHAGRILGEIDDLHHLLGASKGEPQGLLRVNATLGFGRAQVAPLIARFVKHHPKVEVQLQLSVNPPPLSDDSFDLCIRFGAPPDARVLARLLAPNRRLLVASPSYLARAGEPKVPSDLARHNCIGIRQGDEAYGLWRLRPLRGKDAREQAVKTRGARKVGASRRGTCKALRGSSRRLGPQLEQRSFLGHDRSDWHGADRHVGRMPSSGECLHRGG